MTLKLQSYLEKQYGLQLRLDNYPQMSAEIQSILAHFDRLLPEGADHVSLHKIFSTIAGTSTGAIIAAGLTVPKNRADRGERLLSPEEIV